MAMTIENLESSLPVPSVKEIAFQKPNSVPSRYVRDEIITHSDDRSVSVPLIDMKKLLSPDTRASEFQKFHSACKEWGAFQIINHGISEELLENMGKQSREFFELPIEEKKRWAQKPGCLEGFGQAFVTSEDQKLDWNDMLFIRALPEQTRKWEYWPENPQKFRETLESYADEIRKLSVWIAKLMAEGLGLESDDTRELCRGYQEGSYQVRMNYYPICPQPERVFGVSPHQDISGITLLLDCGHKPALQVEKDGQWIPVLQIPGALVLDLGNMTQMMSNGKYHASNHRAIVNNSCVRHSVVTFCYPTCLIGPFKSLLAKSGSDAIFKTLTFDQYFEAFLNRNPDEPFIETLKV